ncbi:MAG: hypothetical protein ACYTBJ_18705 [Planctomycetota bacterium]|jgi:hypothetical protein
MNNEPRKRAIEAHRARVEKETEQREGRLNRELDKSALLLLEELTEWFGDDTVLFFSTRPGEVLASVEGIEDAVFFGKTIRPIDVLINDIGRRSVFSLSHLGELLSDPAPEPEPEQKPIDEKRFSLVSVNEANALHNAGREFMVHSAASDEYGDTLIIQFTDLPGRSQSLIDDELPF